MALGTSAQKLRDTAPPSILCNILSPTGEGVLYDATYDPLSSQKLLDVIAQAATLSMQQGSVQGAPSSALRGLMPQRLGKKSLQPTRGSAEQSNTSILFGDRLIMKLFRHPEPGLNPDCEISRFLTEESPFANIPPFGGSIEYLSPTEEPTTLCMLQGLVKNQGDGWKWMLEELERYYETYAQGTIPAEELGKSVLTRDQPLGTARTSSFACERAGVALDAAAALGRRTAEMHLALASSSTNPAFSVQPLAAEYLQDLQSAINAQATQAYDLLRKQMSGLAEDTVELAAFLLSQRTRILDGLGTPGLGTPGLGSMDGQRIRIHGDYHLGQVLRVKTDFVILDFEGEPARPLEVRRTKHSPLKDVAGMLRSFNYAAWAALMKYTSRRPEDQSRLEPWARLWEQSASAEFLHAYKATLGNQLLPSLPAAQWSLLDLYLLEKAFYELVYELNSRPDWVKIPLMGVAALLRQELQSSMDFPRGGVTRNNG